MRSSRSRAPDVTLRPTTSRRPRSPVWRRWAAGGAGGARRARLRCRTCSRGEVAASSLPSRGLRRQRAALPPIDADRTIVVVGGHQSPAIAAGYLNPYRLLLADLVVVTMAEAGSPGADRRCVARARPGGDRGRPDRPAAATDRRCPGTEGGVLLHRTAVTRSTCWRSTSPPSTAPTSSMSPGTLPIAPRCTRSSQTVEADVFLVELKAAAVDVVAEAGLASGPMSCSPRTTSCLFRGPGP